jgi:tellurite resistance protein
MVRLPVRAGFFGKFVALCMRSPGESQSAGRRGRLAIGGRINTDGAVPGPRCRAARRIQDDEEHPAMASPTPHEALIHVMVMMSAADRAMSDRELAKIGNIVNTLPAFQGYDAGRIVSAAERCSKILQGDNGLDKVLAGAAKALPQRLHETAYALAVEVAAADLSVGQEELRLLQILRDRLNLDQLTCVAIERGARARHQRV